MKKLLFVFVFALSGISVAQAQSFGVRGGANISNLSGDLRDESRFENKVGFHAGAILNFGIVDDFFSIQPELLYSVKGFKNSDEVYTTVLLQQRRREGKVNYNYLDLPVLAKIKAGPLYFEAGPQASYLLSVNNETKTYDGNGNLITSTRDEKSKEGITEFELGYAAGIGLASRNGISFGVRYNGSLTDFAKDAPSDYFDGDLANARHSTIMVTVGFLLPSAK
ncbi:porin family protein [Pontibacter cellulosilyticus]|uniref:PorT family protein n=1 Tax=Pontibacter cellulosilyticus TaxID=1720253 RepID=A0A923NA97_9BACT|nr:porin family protein [Pontibacter cellulosilyticus]MBC5994692.1 PorT family protein [Pontibacter cellulosilyticus]